MEKWLIGAIAAVFLLSACSEETSKGTGSSTEEKEKTENVEKKEEASGNSVQQKEESTQDKPVATATSSVSEKVVLEDDQKQLGGEGYSDIVGVNMTLSEKDRSVMVDGDTVYIYFFFKGKFYVSVCENGKWIEKDKEIPVNLSKNVSARTVYENRILEVKQDNKDQEFVLHTFDKNGDNIKEVVIGDSRVNVEYKILETSKGDALYIDGNQEIVLLADPTKKYPFKDDENIFTEGRNYVDLDNNEMFSVNYSEGPLEGKKVNIESGKPEYAEPGKQMIWGIGNAQEFAGASTKNSLYFYETFEGDTMVYLYNKETLASSGVEDSATVKMLSEKNSWDSVQAGEYLYLYEFVPFENQSSVHIAKFTYSE
ncbi:hypothetical protein SFC65_20030 [Priestia filamentosa]|uniref:hypothetical protein n=1 Tax=Priestia filamentosa TaxID=1402861 RepID=UPI0039826CF1